MKHRPILFNAEMVRAILDGRKTQTRRVIKWKQTRFTEIGEREDGSRWPWSEDAENVCDYWHPCPLGAVGDRLWVRETFAVFDADWKFPGRPDDLKCSPWPHIVYPADDVTLPPGTCRPSIHMPRWASRITLEITGVRVERLQEITLGDICKEMGCGLYDFRPATHGFQVWEDFWESIHGSGSWQANPWVWVVEFKMVDAS